MLYLAPPFHIIDGVCIFRDHEDKLQYYYMPMYPHLTTIRNNDTGVDVPQIQLIKYRGEAGNGGFLNFDVNLGLDDERLQELIVSIKTLEELSETPRLVPVPLLDGTVKLMMLGKQTQDPVDGTAAPTGTETTDNLAPRFVIDMQHYAKPALYGSNQAAFSVQLDEAGVVVIEEAIQGEIAPIGVVYALDYMCLRDGYKVKVNADWDRVQKHLDKSFSVNTLIYSSTIDTIVDELIESRVIDIQVDKLFVTDESTEAMEARMDQAINQLKDMVLDNFFEPSLEPIPTKGSDTIGEVGRVAMILASAGTSENKLFSYKKTDITRIDNKRLNVNFSERTAVIRSIYPQGHLEGLFNVLRQPSIDLSRFVIPIELDNPWFKRREVKVIARSDFDIDMIDSISVVLQYNNISKNVLLDKTNLSEKVHWLSKLADGQMIEDVACEYTVHFKNADSMERPTFVTSAKEIIKTENYEVRPRDVYSNIPIAIMALDFPWEIYKHVEVAVKYIDEENNIKIDENFILKKDHAEIIWQLFSMNRNKNTFTYQLTYRAADHRDIIMPWQESTEENIIIRDPFPNKRIITYVAAVNWTEISLIFVDVVYKDEENSIREYHSVNFNETDSNPKDISINQFKNPEARIVSYKITLIYSDGRVLEVPTCQTLAERVIITSAMRGHKIMLIDPSGIDFLDKKIREAKLQIRFEDETAKLSFNDNFSFLSAADRPRYFEYDFVDPDHSEASYQLELHFENGMKKVSNWIETKNDLLKLTAF